MAIHQQVIEQSKPHVLVVDDEIEIRDMVSLCLQKSGFNVSTVDNAESAYELLELGSYHAIVTDVMMPGEDGISFLERVHKTWPDIPVILMTGHAQRQLGANSIKNGAFDFVYKPFDFDHLRKIVERAVDYTKLQQMDNNYSQNS